jgi:glycosyltransferase involved in cell wall biosynthesis
MKAADLLLLTSYHEAAPMVIDEAYILGLPTLTTKTSSSEEMVSRRNCGWVCENNQVDLSRALLELLQDPASLQNKKEMLRNCRADNGLALKQFDNILQN